MEPDFFILFTDRHRPPTTDHRLLITDHRFPLSLHIVVQRGK